VQTRSDTTAPSSLRLRLQARAESAFILRRRLCAWLDELGASSDEVFDLSLASSEAFANAVEHPHEPTSRAIEVEGGFSDATVTVMLHDFGSWGDQRQREEGGYGFPMMRRLVDTVEVEMGSEGTSITLQRRIGAAAGWARRPLGRR
jgi:anti-sigma regulatory factor (Ser/Thr protein kinase)